VFFQVAFKDFLIQFDLTSLPQGIFCCILNGLKSALDKVVCGFLLLNSSHLLEVHYGCFGSCAGSKLRRLVHNVLVVFLFDRKLLHIRASRDWRYVVYHLLDVLDELACRLIVGFTQVNSAQIFTAPWRAHRHWLR
jgi:hypothetical protein